MSMCRTPIAPHGSCGLQHASIPLACAWSTHGCSRSAFSARRLQNPLARRLRASTSRSRGAWRVPGGREARNEPCGLLRRLCARCGRGDPCHCWSLLHGSRRLAHTRLPCKSLRSTHASVAAALQSLPHNPCLATGSASRTRRVSRPGRNVSQPSGRRCCCSTTRTPSSSSAGAAGRRGQDGRRHDSRSFAPGNDCQWPARGTTAARGDARMSQPASPATSQGPAEALSAAAPAAAHPRRQLARPAVGVEALCLRQGEVVHRRRPRCGRDRERVRRRLPRSDWESELLLLREPRGRRYRELLLLR
jgi:hypothetical protein